jgi:hypothetical protein
MKSKFRRRWTVYLEATGEAFGDSLDLFHIVFAKERRADCLPPTALAPHAGAFLVSVAKLFRP